MAMGEGMKKGVRVHMVSDSPAVESSSSSDNSSTRMTSSSIDLSDDASSPSREPCCDPVEADDQTSPMNRKLPIRRGLSKFYQGKSQSYHSLSDVKNIEDLPKKVMPLDGKMKQSRSYAGGLDGCSSMPSLGTSYGCGNSTVTNKGSISMRMGSGGAVGRCKLPPVPAAHKNVF